SYKVSLVVTKGNVSGNLEKTVTVKPHPTSYCEVSRRGSYARRNDVTKVVFGDINNTTPKGDGYRDFKVQSTNLVEGQVYPIELTTYQQITNTTSEAATNLIVWIDWNRNNEFSIDEIAYERRSIASDTPDMVLNANITVPKIYANGTSLMRIIRYYSYDKENRPRCGEIVEADIEDYTVNLSGSGIVVNSPVAEFTANSTTITEGASVSFIDQSTNEPTSWAWSFVGGTPATSALQNPSVTYNTPGTYQVVLTATNLGGSNAVTKTGYITVNDSNPNTGVEYCASAGTRIQYEWIAGVKVGTFTNTTVAAKYGNYISKKIPLSVNTATSVTLTPGYSGNPTDEYFKVWIDYNKDGTFDANEVAFDSGSAKKNAQTGTITVPSSAKTGETRMRVSMKYRSAPTSSCGNIGDGSVQDYTVNIGGGTVINAPVANFNANRRTLDEGGVVRFTDTSSNDPVSWNWTFEGGTPTTSTSQTPNIRYNKAGTYQVVLTVTNAGGNDSETKVGYITVKKVVITPTPEVYCNTGNKGSNYIAGVTFGSIDNTSENTAYSDFTSQKTTVEKGSSVTLTVTPGIVSSNWNSNVVGAWIDWNQDGDFIDVGEEVLMKPRGTGAGSATVTIPNDAKEGATRLRVRYRWSSNPSPCGVGSANGDEVEDYTVNVSGGTTTTPNEGNVIYVDMTDVTVSSSTTWKPFEIEKGDGDKRFYGWHTGGNLKMLYTTNKPLVTNGTTGNITFISEGVTVGNSNNYKGDSQLNLTSNSFTDWNGKSGYIGFNFKIGGATHYGWLYVTVSTDGKSVTFKDYAYN
ncbi:GEVED domain-containing protein, partial [Tenacibaculum sp.]|nr:GEVED domain-containing protein [Tenacibaculum sp.]